jgi:hypothetical protein
MSERIGRLRRMIAFALFIALGCTRLALAGGPGPVCYDCDDCRSEVACSMCVLVALRHECATYGPNAYCTCDHNVWNCFCDRDRADQKTAAVGGTSAQAAPSDGSLPRGR